MIFDREYYINQSIPIKKELIALFRKRSKITIFEIGACEGEDSIRYSNLFPNSKIYTFEPLSKNIERINTNITKYNKKNISVHPYALSNTNGVAKFHISSGTPEGQENNETWDFGNKSSSLLEPDKHLDLVKFINFKNEEIVNTLTLDTFCKNSQIDVIDFIHMDVQGAELMVLTGAIDTISSVKAIWLEVSNVTLYKDQPLSGDIENFMIAHNFVLIKNTVDDLTGDQLYISKSYFPNYSEIFPIKPPMSESLLLMVQKFKSKSKRALRSILRSNR